MFENHCPADCRCEAVDVWRNWTNALFYAEFVFNQKMTFEVRIAAEVTDNVYFF